MLTPGIHMCAWARNWLVKAAEFTHYSQLERRSRAPCYLHINHLTFVAPIGSNTQIPASVLARSLPVEPVCACFFSLLTQYSQAVSSISA